MKRKGRHECQHSKNQMNALIRSCLRKFSYWMRWSESPAPSEVAQLPTTSTCISACNAGPSTLNPGRPMDQAQPPLETLVLDLNNPQQAREFCKDFVIFTSHGGRPLRPHYVDVHGVKGDRRIVFETMSDEDAVIAANMLMDLQMDQLAAAKARGELQ